MATIKDVAERSNTSIGTVSRYLNGYNIKDINRERIEDAIEKLDFRINPIARGLKTNKTMTIGVLIPELSNLFSTSVIEGMDKIFDQHGYSIIVCDSKKSVKKEEEKIQFLMDKYVDGIVVMPTSDSGAHIKQAIDAGCCVVLMDRLIKDLKCDAVVCDNINGAYDAVEKIIVKGHRKIGIIAGPKEISTARERLEGYKRALMDYNIAFDEKLIVYSDYTKETSEEAFEKLLEINPECTAVFATNYETTIGVVSTMVRRNLKIGKDLSVFGYDQNELTQIIQPAISVVIQPLELIGQKAAEILIKRIQGDYSKFPMMHRLKTKIVSTDSVKQI